MKRFMLKWRTDVPCTTLFCHQKHSRHTLAWTPPLKFSFPQSAALYLSVLIRSVNVLLQERATQLYRGYALNPNGKGEVKSIYNALCIQKVIKYVVIVGKEAIPALTGQTLNAEHLPIASINKISAVLPFSPSSWSMCFLEQLSAQGKEQRVTLRW